MKLTNIQKEQILNLKNQGYSSRQIALQVLGSKTKKSTVNDYLKQCKNTTIQNTPKSSKILLLDIENSPSLGYYWNRWKTTIHESQVLSESFIISFAYMWYGDNSISCEYLDSREVLNEDDKGLVEKLHKLLSEADIVVAHNGLKFDIPVINTRLIYHGFTEPLPFKIVDTYQIAKKVFRFPSNSLKALANYLKLVNRKTEPEDGFNLWRRCTYGDKEALELMSDYNINDIIVLEELYTKLRPWDKLHPNVSVYTDSNKITCLTCGSENLEKVNKLSYTAMSAYETYRCSDCGKILRGRKNILNRNNLLTNVQ